MIARKKANVSGRAMLKRFEQLIDVLRTRYVCDGWRLDEEGAAHALHYFRRRASGGRGNAKDWHVVCEFLRRHGQSLDWIVRGDPGGMICTLARAGA